MTKHTVQKDCWIDLFLLITKWLWQSKGILYNFNKASVDLWSSKIESRTFDTFDKFWLDNEKKSSENLRHHKNSVAILWENEILILLEGYDMT